MSTRRTAAQPGAGALGRAASVAMAAGGALALVLTLSISALSELRVHLDAGRPLATLPLELLVTSLAGLALAGSATWLAAVTIATAFEVMTGASSATVRALSPRVVRRLVLACCGLAVGGAGICAPAWATPGTSASEGPAGDGLGSAVLAGLPLPDRVVGEAPATASVVRLRSVDTRAGYDGGSVVMTSATRPGSSRPGSTQTPTTYEVRQGDCLWTIAERLLPAADAAELGTAWRRIHRANRPEVGPDADLIIPGTTLRLPEPLTGHADTRGPGEHGPLHHRKDAS